MKLDINSKEYETIIEEMKEGKKLVRTRWGNAKIDNYGHYRITSMKEGFNGKFVHRLIWENFYGKKIPDGYDIHHVDGNKLNNGIQNLQCVEHSKHVSFHKKGENHPMWEKNHTLEARKKMSDANLKKHARITKRGFNSTGKQRYIVRFNGKNLMESVDIGKLINRFSKEYPSEILVIPNSIISELRRS